MHKNEVNHMEHFKMLFWFLGGKFRKLFFMSVPESEEDYKHSRNMYILADTMYQTIANLAGGTFLMTLLASLDISDGTIGTVLSIGSLAAVFQLLILKFIQNLKKYKLYVTLTIFQRVWFGIIFFIPFLNCSTKIKGILVILLYLAAQILSQASTPVLVSWIAYLIPERIRGEFLAKKEAIAVFITVFSIFLMGIVFDYFSGSHLSQAFLIIGIILILLSLVNTAVIIRMHDPHPSLVNEAGKELHGHLARRAEKNMPKIQKSFFQIARETFQNSGFQKCLVVSVLWNLCYYIACPFMSSYTIRDLGLSYTYVTLIGLLTTILRVSILPFMGRFSDRKGAEKALSLSLFILMLSSLINVFLVPENATVLYIASSLVAAVGWSYIGAGLLNIQLKYLDQEKQTEQYTILSASCGVMAMGISFVGGKILDFLQQHKPVFFGKALYAQQILNGVSAVLMMIMILYVLFGVKKKQ